MFAACLLQSGFLLQDRRYTTAQIQQFWQQLAVYKSGHTPYGLTIAEGSKFSAKQWWLNLPLDSDGKQMIIVRLAVILFDIIPHSAAPECLFSMLKWMQAPLRNRLAVATMEKMSTIKQHMQQQAAPEAPKRKKPSFAPAVPPPQDPEVVVVQPPVPPADEEEGNDDDAIDENGLDDVLALVEEEEVLPAPPGPASRTPEYLRLPTFRSVK